MLSKLFYEINYEGQTKIHLIKKSLTVLSIFTKNEDSYHVYMIPYSNHIVIIFKLTIILIKLLLKDLKFAHTENSLNLSN